MQHEPERVLHVDIFDEVGCSVTVSEPLPSADVLPRYSGWSELRLEVEHLDRRAQATPRERYLWGSTAYAFSENLTFALTVSSAVATAVYQLLKAWVDARNGRKLKIKVGDIEVEATQMNEDDVLRIFELLEEKTDRKKIRAALIEAGKGGDRPNAH